MTSKIQTNTLSHTDKHVKNVYLPNTVIVQSIHIQYTTLVLIKLHSLPA